MDENSIRSSAKQRLLEGILAQFRTLDPLASPAIETAFLAPLMGVGDFLSVSGEAGCGKTMLAADALLGFAHPARQGSALAGLLQFNPIYNCEGNVGIIDAENSPLRWQSLLKRKMEAEGLDPNVLRGTIEYVSPYDVGLHHSTQWTERSHLLAEALAARAVRFVIIDSLGRAWSPDDLNSTAWVQQGLAPFRIACRDRGIAVLALTHTKRSTGPSGSEAVGPLGSSLQEAQVDAQVMMTLDPDGRGCRLKMRKSRRAYWIRPGASINVDFTDQLGYRPQEDWPALWPHECPEGDEGLGSNPGTRTKILKLLEDDPGSALRSTAIASTLGCTARTVTNHLHMLEGAGRVLREGDGPATQWRRRP